ncbi:MAG: LysR family transcriptional regulator [Spirochaetales bacterium]|nr:LysR family transcriptional regulator [Candidatus Physcosoma equi]
MDIETLKLFIAVVEQGTFLKAAKVTNTTQPNISKHIASLEKECGVRLFIRDKAGARLTEEGKLFLSAARDIVLRADKVLEELGKIAKPDVDMRLRVAVPDNLDLERIVPGFFLSLLSDDEEELKIKLVKLPEEEIEGKLENGDVDCSFYQSIYRLDNPDTVGFAVTRSNPVLLYSEKHPVNKKKKITVEEFKSSKFFRCTTGRELVSLYASLPFEPQSIEEVFEEGMAMMYIESGEGAGIFVPGVTELGKAAMRTLELETADKVGIDLVYQKSKESPAIERFAEKLKEYQKNNN